MSKTTYSILSKTRQTNIEYLKPELRDLIENSTSEDEIHEAKKILGDLESLANF